MAISPPTPKRTRYYGSRTSDPSTSGLETGTWWYRSDLGVFAYWDGTSIQYWGPFGGLTVDTVGENVDPGEICYMKADGKYWLADADDVDHMPAKVMAMETITANNEGKLLRVGEFRNDAWAWTLGNGQANLLFVHTTPGAMVQFANKPAGSGDQVQVVGYVVDEDRVFFNPSYELVEIS